MADASDASAFSFSWCKLIREAENAVFSRHGTRKNLLVGAIMCPRAVHFWSSLAACTAQPSARQQRESPLPSRRPLVPNDRIRRAWAAPTSATPRRALQISSDLFRHGSLILTQSLHFITMGTFHTVLDLINGVFPGFRLPPLFTVSVPVLSRPALLVFPCSWAHNLTSPGAQPP